MSQDVIMTTEQSDQPCDEICRTLHRAGLDLGCEVVQFGCPGHGLYHLVDISGFAQNNEALRTMDQLKVIFYSKSIEKIKKISAD
jgi:hypothetical protein